MRCIIIQPYVAPYRYDFFRMLAGKIDLKVLYLWPTPGVDESEETLQQKLGACQVKRLTGHSLPLIVSFFTPGHFSSSATSISSSK